MKIFIALFLSCILSSPSWAYLTSTKIAVTKTSSSSGVSSTSQDSDVTDIVASGNVGIGSTTPQGNLDVPGTICFSHSCLSAWPAGGSQTSGTNMLFGNGTGGYTNVAGSGTVGGNVGIGSSNPGQKLDVQGTVRATSFTGQSGHGLFGSWTSASACLGTPCQAATDGFVIAYTITGTTSTAEILTDSSNPPTTVRAADTLNNASFRWLGCPVRKGDWYEITQSASDLTAEYWLPVGS